MVEIIAQLSPALACVNCYEVSPGVQTASYETALVNQGFATKIKRVSSIEHAYPTYRPKAKQVWNIFKVTPRNEGSKISITVLERHPYTTQTFVPLGGNAEQIEFLAVVAEDREGQPDPTSLRAWLCHGGQLVTYAANQWHAPMIALHDQLIFAVTNAENNTGDDLEEFFFTPEAVPQVVLNLSKNKNRSSL
ncbi:Probable ureidoglycolate hydrolase [Taphrina deformans PYCC 5710]|uniref:Probable ureidoglycolate hydrolase n=1 Tax=Taphrina deformans (strain PYCC 5710 / ATCC 11124 / CBS 356.35 / IMI 108563 / JCM 9778 / NBRC 8474) TaxID=1097556 RepID=R4XC31_TAPDE|nr:Probable ureidoglycolate hydrolase [Taphrina deformans PYCC 5710]|eukprot:CCG83110.1 Probable ureidoglycolate hydrolase [Taphrina deformans PYCC 5710]